eukprot:3000384-Pleurochrysis_carterae.AAC.1
MANFDCPSVKRRECSLAPAISCCVHSTQDSQCRQLVARCDAERKFPLFEINIQDLHIREQDVVEIQKEDETWPFRSSLLFPQPVFCLPPGSCLLVLLTYYRQFITDKRTP